MEELAAKDEDVYRLNAEARCVAATEVHECWMLYFDTWMTPGCSPKVSIVHVSYCRPWLSYGA